MLGTLSLCTRVCVTAISSRHLVQNRMIRSKMVRDHCWESFTAERRYTKSVHIGSSRVN